MATMLRWDPWAELSTIQRDLSELFARTGEGRNRGERSWVPAVDMYRDNDSFVVHVELPGVKPADVDIEVNDGVLFIRGERRVDDRFQNGSRLRIERHFGRFERQITLPDGVEADKIEAAYENGVLEIKVPQPQAAQPHKIAIKGAEHFEKPETVEVSSN